MASYTECHPANSCITCPVKKLSLSDELKASELIEVVMEKAQPNANTSVDELVTAVKDEADILESDELAGIAIGAIAYRLAGRCPQFVENEKGGRTVIVHAVNI